MLIMKSLCYRILLFLLLFCVYTKKCQSKYIEGYLKTLDDWVFLARFCFISGRGRYEYEIEFERRYGEPQLLLYYDDKSQWPAVYKTEKTCIQKLAVLSRIDNQIVTLSTRSPFNILSGCTLKLSEPPDVTNSKSNPDPIPTQTTSTTDHPDNNDSSYFNKFFKTTTPSSYTTENNFDTNFDGNYSDTIWSNFTPVDSDNLIDRNFNYQNDLENNTNFEMDVEELFDNRDFNITRVRRYANDRLAQIDRTGTNKVIVSCRNVGGFTSSRERWWYIAIANCGTQKGINIKYRFLMTNGPPGDIWHEHFSADEIYIPPILLTECLAYSFLLLAIFLCAIELKTRHLFHCTYRLFTFSAFIQWVGVLCQGVAWAKYAVTGIGPQTVLGGIFMGASEVSFLCLMLLLAKGYTITRARLSSCTTTSLTVFINVYIIVFISLYIYQAEVFDAGEVLNLYESPAGFGLNGLKICAWVAFIIAIVTTVQRSPEKSAFYYPFGLLGSLWLLGGPILCVIGIGVFDPWVRESVMCGVFAFIAFSGHAAFLWLTWPSRANKSFPYHVRTNHVGILVDNETEYPRHPYAPTVMPERSEIAMANQSAPPAPNPDVTQYMREREFYNSSSTPTSHVCFPQTPSVQSALEHNDFYYNTDDIKMLRGVMGNENDDQNAIEISYETRASPKDGQIEIDSGHPSLDNSTCSPKETDQSLKSKTNIVDLSKDSDDIEEKPAKKNNPFVVNGYSRGPNKVILEPIEYPIKSPQNKGNGTDVPKHLFAAKSRNKET